MRMRHRPSGMQRQAHLSLSSRNSSNSAVSHFSIRSVLDGECLGQEIVVIVFVFFPRHAFRSSHVRRSLHLESEFEGLSDGETDQKNGERSQPSRVIDVSLYCSIAKRRTHSGLRKWSEGNMDDESAVSFTFQHTARPANLAYSLMRLILIHKNDLPRILLRLLWSQRSISHLSIHTRIPLSDIRNRLHETRTSRTGSSQY